MAANESEDEVGGAFFGVTESPGHVANENRIAFWAESAEEVARLVETAVRAGARNVAANEAGISDGLSLEDHAFVRGDWFVTAAAFVRRRRFFIRRPPRVRNVISLSSGKPDSFAWRVDILAALLEMHREDVR